MIKKIILLVFVGTLFTLQGCYDDYKQDFDYSATYFARQYPLRTVVIEEGKDLTFDVGAVLGGKYSNETNEQIDFSINSDYLDETLFPTLTGLEDVPAGLSTLTELPSSHYTIGSENIIIPSGKFVGSTTITLNEDLFLNDPLAVGKNYVLPFEITNATTDSILDGKHFSLVVIKYINQYEGWYYLKGTDTNTVDPSKTVTYSEEDIVLNEDMLLETISRNEVKVPYAGDPGFVDRGMNFSIANDGTVTISDGTGVTDLSGSGTYDSDTRNFTIEYSYTDGDGALHNVSETLTYRNTELVLDDWLD